MLAVLLFVCLLAVVYLVALIGEKRAAPLRTLTGMRDGSHQ